MDYRKYILSFTICNFANKAKLFCYNLFKCRAKLLSASVTTINSSTSLEEGASSEALKDSLPDLLPKTAFKKQSETGTILLYLCEAVLLKYSLTCVSSS